jgi:hypothetical protein
MRTDTVHIRRIVDKKTSEVTAPISGRMLITRFRYLFHLLQPAVLNAYHIRPANGNDELALFGAVGDKMVLYFDNTTTW